MNASAPDENEFPPRAGSSRFDRPFCDELAALASGPGIRKGERTRLRLLSATAQLLQEQFVHTVRVGDICATAGVAPGTFYQYFSDKLDVTTAMLAGFVHHLFAHLGKAAEGAEGLAASVHATTLAYVREFEMNRGLFRALMQMTEESERIEAIYQGFNNRWNRRTARVIARCRGVEGPPEEEDILRAFALGGMVDEFLANVYVRRDPALTERLTTSEETARLLADLWLDALPRGAGASH